MGSLSQMELAPSSSHLREPLLAVRELRVTYVKEKGLFLKRRFLIKALDGISFEVAKSEFIAIVGETGSGKTTLARCIMGLTRPNSGAMLFAGKEIASKNGGSLKDHRRRVQIVYQDPYESLNPSQDVYRMLSTPIKRLLGEREEAKIQERVRNVLRDVGLDPEEVLHRYPHQLSGGQRQRVNIARALAPEPELLIADEPITMLDAEQRMNILALLKELKEKKKLTVVMITHDLASALVTSDRIIVMYMGKIVESGPTKELVRAPHHPYVELVLASAPRIRTERAMDRSLEKLAPMEENLYPLRGCVFAPRCQYATEICQEKEPEFASISSERYVACYHPLNSVKKK